MDKQRLGQAATEAAVKTVTTSGILTGLALAVIGGIHLYMLRQVKK